MLDFFDEDFPLTKKQEEMIKAMKEAANEAAAATAPSAAEIDAAPIAAPSEAEQPVQTYSEAAPVTETAPEPIAEAPAQAAAEPAPAQAYREALQMANTEPEPVQNVIPEVAEPVSEPIPEITAEPVAETISEITAEPVAETIPEITAEPVAETIPEITAEPVPETIPEVAVETIPEEASEIAAEAAAQSVSEAAEPVAEAKPADDIPPAADYASSEGSMLTPEPVSAPEFAENNIAEAVQDDIPLPEPMAARSAEDDEEAAIRRIFQPIHKEEPVPESDNQAFSYEYDSRYYAEEETPAYKYGVSSSARRRTRPARTEAGNGNITVSTKTLLKVGAVVAATAAAVKLLSKKD